MTLIDKSAAHISCILSNLVINGRLGMSNITLAYDTLKNVHGVNVLQDSVTGVDPTAKTIFTKNNTIGIGYDRLVLAPGIAFDTPSYENLPAGKDFYYLVPHAWSAGEKTPVGNEFSVSDQYPEKPVAEHAQRWCVCVDNPQGTLPLPTRTL